MTSKITDGRTVENGNIRQAIYYVLLAGWLEFSVPFQLRYGYIRDDYVLLITELTVGHYVTHNPSDPSMN